MKVVKAILLSLLYLSVNKEVLAKDEVILGKEGLRLEANSSNLSPSSKDLTPKNDQETVKPESYNSVTGEKGEMISDLEQPLLQSEKIIVGRDPSSWAPPGKDLTYKKDPETGKWYIYNYVTGERGKMVFDPDQRKKHRKGGN
jgi:hypothetical protein